MDVGRRRDDDKRPCALVLGAKAICEPRGQNETVAGLGRKTACRLQITQGARLKRFLFRVEKVPDFIKNSYCRIRNWFFGRLPAAASIAEPPMASRTFALERKVGEPGMHRSSSFGRVTPHSYVGVMNRGARSSFGSRVSLDFEERGHSTRASIKTYSEFTLPHPLLRSRSPFALPPRDHTPSTERAAQVYSARAVTYDEGSHTGPQFAIHHKGWGRPCSTGVGESGKFELPSWARHGS